MKDLLKAISLIVIAIFLSSCAANLHSMPARITSQTAAYNDLTSLPPPKSPIYAAVFSSFRDRTGQYKDSDSFTNSTAINQGNASILIKALEDSGWVINVEREGLNNLLTERKIIRSTRAEYEAKTKNSLPPLSSLKYASVIFEGGVISYETNVATGGAVARYFGIGGSTEYRHHQVTVYLRATSIDNGVVLKTVSVTKSVFSKKVDFNLFRYVRFKRLLELEGGITANEPLQMCVREAIEKAVHDLLIEGILSGYWSLKNPEDIKSPVIRKYLDEKMGKGKQVVFDKKGNIVKDVIKIEEN